jgi:hypothetical protein
MSGLEDEDPAKGGRPAVRVLLFSLSDTPPWQWSVGGGLERTPPTLNPATAAIGLLR